MAIKKRLIASFLCAFFSASINASAINSDVIVDGKGEQSLSQIDARTAKYATQAVQDKLSENADFDYPHPDVIKVKLLQTDQFNDVNFTVTKLNHKLYVIYIHNTKELMYTDSDAEIIFTGEVYDTTGKIFVSDLIRMDYQTQENRRQLIRNKQELINKKKSSSATNDVSSLNLKQVKSDSNVNHESNNKIAVPQLLKKTQPTDKKILSTHNEMTIKEIASLPPATLSVASYDFKRRCLSYAIANSANINQLIRVLNQMPQDSRKKCGLVMSEAYAPNLKDERLIVYKAKGEEKDVLTIYHDPLCGFCKKLQNEKEKLNEKGVTVRVYMYGRHPYSTTPINYDNINYAAFTPTAKAMSQAICASTNAERQKLNDDMMQGGNSAIAKIAEMPSPSQQCLIRVMAMKNFGDILTGVSTPLSVSTNKKLAISGYRSANEMAKLLDL